MSTDKQVADEDNETVGSSTEKTDEQEDGKSSSSSSKSDNDDTDSNASSEYEVEKVLAKRRRRRGGYEYYIKWVGYDKSANEWIPEESLNCPERVAEFHRAEAKKQKRSGKDKDKSSIKKRRKKNKLKRARRRPVKVIHDDDDEEEEPQSTKSVQSSVSCSTHAEKESKRSSITYGVEKGYTVQAILGINRTKSDQLHYLVHYKSPTDLEDNMELIPSTVAKKFCEDEVIQFYETRILWNDRQND